MLNDKRKQSIIDACAGFEKNQKKKAKRAKSYGSPEADFVIEFLTFTKKHSKFFSLNVIEAKGVYDPDAGRYSNGQVEPGYPDISGNNSNGIAMYLEAKAPGKRGTISLGQYMFLMRKIEMNCFAICFDSIDYFKSTYKTWLSLDGLARQKYLIKSLPTNKSIRDVLGDDSDIF